ncbi:XRE family transcriptional regulator [Cellulomonas rhizosphaerae]|uniref:XRE family transcriptional regulator n=1 Tax=Cellulomonas rhizosphaerae TaxID=2293719 RepID=A0A413RJB8_9CELL|nr:XRE family transcriptional regulator [Cellulomonas rhizosphaerae]RHA38681.1 XRE family transcriptional regulator [Cellulomonas rhizosphaerae]
MLVVRKIERRFDVELVSRDAFRRYMAYRDHSARTLADAATRRGVPTSKATIGHLMSGFVKQTRPERAKAICEVLDVPVDALFVVRVSTVQRDVPPAPQPTKGMTR